MGRFFSWLGNLFKSCIDGIIGFFVSLWDIIWNLFEQIGSWFLDWFNYVWDFVIYGYYASLDWIIKQFVQFLDYLSTVISIDLDSYLETASSFAPYVQSVNVFLPLDVICICAGVYFSTLVVWCIYKFIKSWIPTISGT